MNNLWYDPTRLMFRSWMWTTCVDGLSCWLNCRIYFTCSSITTIKPILLNIVQTLQVEVFVTKLLRSLPLTVFTVTNISQMAMNIFSFSRVFLSSISDKTFTGLWVTRRVSNRKQELLNLCERECFVLFVFVLCLVSNVLHVSLDCPFGFL